MQVDTTASCYGHTHGHDYAGGVCMRCGGSQEYTGAFRRATRPVEAFPASRRGYIPPTRFHELISEISEFFDEKQMWKTYWFGLRPLGEHKVRQLFRDAKDYTGDAPRVKYFWKLVSLAKEQHAKNQKKKTS